MHRCSLHVFPVLNCNFLTKAIQIYSVNETACSSTKNLIGCRAFSSKLVATQQACPASINNSNFYSVFCELTDFCVYGQFSRNTGALAEIWRAGVLEDELDDYDPEDSDEIARYFRDVSRLRDKILLKDSTGVSAKKLLELLLVDDTVMHRRVAYEIEEKNLTKGSTISEDIDVGDYDSVLSEPTPYIHNANVHGVGIAACNELLTSRSGLTGACLEILCNNKYATFEELPGFTDWANILESTDTDFEYARDLYMSAVAYLYECDFFGKSLQTDHFTFSNFR